MPFQWMDKLLPKRKSENQGSRISLVNFLGKLRAQRINPLHDSIPAHSSKKSYSSFKCPRSSTQHFYTNTHHTSPTSGVQTAATTTPSSLGSQIQEEENTDYSIHFSEALHRPSEYLNLCNHKEILTYIEHLDENTFKRLVSEDGGKRDANQKFSKHKKCDIVLENEELLCNVVDPLNSNFGKTPKSHTSIISSEITVTEGEEDSYEDQDQRWTDATEETILESESDQDDTDVRIIESNKNIQEMSSKPLLESNGDMDAILVWNSIDTILENFGLTFLDMVSKALMLVTVTAYRDTEKKHSIPDVETISKTRILPKIIVMIDDPPESDERKNLTMGRLLSVGLYLLGIQLFVIPCHDFAAQALHSMINKLLENRQSYPTFRVAYNFMLQIGLSQLLQRNDTDVIIFDGDWVDCDVCHLISLAETFGHHLIFMKNHPGIHKKPFVNVVIARIQTRLTEFGDRHKGSVNSRSEGSIIAESETTYFSSHLNARGRRPKADLKRTKRKLNVPTLIEGLEEFGGEVELQNEIKFVNSIHLPTQTVFKCEVVPAVQVSESSAQVDETDMNNYIRKYPAIRRTKSSTK